MPSIPFIFHQASDIWEFNHKAAFDGPNKLIIVNRDLTAIDVKVDLYSDWKEWSTLRNNLQYEAALRAVGGDPTLSGSFLGSTFFLINGWRVRTWEGDHELIVNGNMFVDGGGTTFVPTEDPHNILITSNRSNLVDLLVVTASALEPGDQALLASIGVIVSNLPDSGSLTTITNNTETMKIATVMKSGNILNGSIFAVTTSIDTPSATFDNMFLAVTSGSTSVARKIETHRSGTEGGIFIFDVALPYAFTTGSVTVLPGYNPINGRIG